MSTNLKIFLITLAVLVVSGGFIFFQKGKISVIEDNLNPVQKSNQVVCENFDKVSMLFENDLTTVKEKGIDTYDDKTMVKTNDNSPLFRLKPIKLSLAELNEDQMSKVLNYFQRNIEPNLFKLGLKKEFTYSSLNSVVYQFNQNGSKYVISLPTNAESPVMDDVLRVSCTSISDEEMGLYSLIKDNYKEDETIDIWDNIDNVLRVNIASKDTFGGSSDVYDIRSKPEKIYSGQEAVLCSILKERNIGKGFVCLDLTQQKYITNE